MMNDANYFLKILGNLYALVKEEKKYMRTII